MLISEIMERGQAQRKRDAGTVNDQFFTRPEVAQQFADWVRGQPWYSEVTRAIEPAAGARDLSKHFPGIEEYDLDPQWADITQQDFFASNFRYQPGFLVVMNPPFGKGSDLAMQFFNKAAGFADYIAQIVPRTFRRASIQNRLSMDFDLVDEYVLPRGSFYLPHEGPNHKYDVPAVAQIWRRSDEPRQAINQPRASSKFAWARPESADFAFRRKGRRAGEIVTQNIEQTNPNSFFYIKGDPRVFQQVNWKEYGNDVMGARSISQADVAQAVG